MSFAANNRHSLIRLPSGTTYCYLYQAPSFSKTHPKLPVILFLHGFPSSSFDWRHQLLYFTSRGYGCLAPDMLGYGETDQPLDVHAYKMSKLAGEMVELLDHLKIDKVFGVGHDWGSTLLSNLLRLHTERFLAFAFLATYYTPSNPYMSEGHEFDYKAVSEASKKNYGFDAFGHTIFLGDAERAGKILDDHIDSFYSLVYPREVKTMKEHFRKEGGIEAWVTADRTGERPMWLSENDKKICLRVWKEGNGFTPKCNWYRQLLEGVSLEDDGKWNHDLKSRVKQPVFLMIETQDVPGRGATAKEAAEKVAENVRVQTFDTGHWIQLEDPDETNVALEDFFNEVMEAEA